MFAEKAGNANSCPPGLNLEQHFLTEGLTGGSVVKNLLPMQEIRDTQVQFLGWEGLLGGDMATHSSILA